MVLQRGVVAMLPRGRVLLPRKALNLPPAQEIQKRLGPYRRAHAAPSVGVTSPLSFALILLL